MTNLDAGPPAETGVSPAETGVSPAETGRRCQDVLAEVERAVVGRRSALELVLTGILAGGATVVCFTTGRGSVFGCRPTPSIKLATNTEMYERMSDDMDINCGRIVDGTASLTDVGDEIFERIIAVASGELTASEDLDIGQEEFVPWQLGTVT